MIIVFDSSTLILLAKITVLRTFTQERDIVIPSSVKEECLCVKAIDADIIRQLLEEKKIMEKNISGSELSADFKLGLGEADALQLARDKKAVLATDDYRAIRTCKVLNIPFTTAIHCLQFLVDEKKIDQRLAFEKLKNLEKYGRYSEQIVNDTKKRIRGDMHG